MWIAEMKEDRFQYFERYKDPYSEKNKTKSTILTNNSPQACKKAQRVLDIKIAHALDEREQQLITFHQVYKESYKSHMSSLRPSSIVVYESAKTRY